jgi:hypothetical protein
MYKSRQDIGRMLRAATTRAVSSQTVSGRSYRKVKPITLPAMSFATAEEGKVRSEMQIKVGGSVIYVDPTGHDRSALVTAVWGPPESNPSINVVVVNDDENQTDTYGRKIERFTSVVHQSNQYAHGNFWKPISE